MTKRVAILQSNYIPWKGYFDLMALVDVFVLFDSMQYTRRDWRNRNLVKTKDGLKWMSIPVETKGRYSQRINETRISGREWAGQHWKTLSHTYAKAKCFDAMANQIEAWYEQAANYEFLSEVNRFFLEKIAEFLGIDTQIIMDVRYNIPEGKSDRIASICQQENAQVYVSGPSARDYLDLSVFDKTGISVEWMEYGGYPEYDQPHGAFEHGVTVLDLLFCLGDRAEDSMKFVNRKGRHHAEGG